MFVKLSKGDVNMIGDTTLEFWHKRLGHMSEKELQMLVKKQLLPDIIGTPLKPCIDYLTAKQHRVAFQRNPPTRKSHILDDPH